MKEIEKGSSRFSSDRLSVLFIKKREHRIKADLFQTLQASK